jgi:polyhydroxybutyrate depolymerase
MASSAEGETKMPNRLAHWLVVVVAGLSTTLVSCGGSAQAPSPHLSPGTTQHAKLTIKGQTRTYRLFQPKSLDLNQKPPLVVVLHPCAPDANGDRQASYSHFDDTAETGKFVAAYPDGIGNCWNFLRHSDRPDDVAFIGSLLDRVSADLPTDKARILLAGISGGAVMSYLLACEMADRVIAIASVSGTMADANCHPAQPVSILEMHGTEDSNIMYEGGGPNNLPSSMAIAQRWSELDGCPSTATESQVGITRTSIWKPCKGGTTVRIDTVVGGHHTWFGSSFDPVPGEPDANAVVWDFLSAATRSK